MNKILSYRGLLETDGQDTILLSTKKGEKGYRITKLQVVSRAPVGLDVEGVIKVYSTEQDSVDAVIDFNKQTLLGCAFYENNSAISGEGQNVIIFDNKIFNQDIYVTCFSSASSINYYMELEVIMLNETEATVATLKDIRNND
jgi:hypothetical protein